MAFYTIASLEQGSQEWLKWRRGVIGASDAPTIMGENPWGSKNYLVKEKLGLNPPFNGNAATREGQFLEEHARRALVAEAGFDLEPMVIQDDKSPHIAASLDAMSANYEHLFEIKCGKKTYEHVADKATVPTYYYGQLQHMLMIVDLPVIYFTVYRPDRKMLTMQVPYDTQYIKRLKIEEEDFSKILRSRGHKLQSKFKGKLVS
jgi:putative phage-type endonuclease